MAHSPTNEEYLQLREKAYRTHRELEERIDKGMYWNALSCCTSLMGTLMQLFDMHLKGKV